MSASIPPTPQPHGYYSQISPNPSLPQHVSDPINKIQEQLNQMQMEAQHPKPDPQNLVEHFKQLDQNLTDFFCELNKNSNRGFEKQVKDKFETIHNHFNDEIDAIKDSHGKSLRDVKYDPTQLSQFLEKLNQTPSGKDDLHHLGNLAGIFAQELSAAFPSH